MGQRCRVLTCGTMDTCLVEFADGFRMVTTTNAVTKAEPDSIGSVPPGRRKRLAVETSNHAFAYVFAGSGTFRDASAPRLVKTEAVGGTDTDSAGAAGRGSEPGWAGEDIVGNRSLVVFDSGDEITVQAGDEGVRFLLVSGKPIEEPVAWYGPIVMNTQEELRRAFKELQDGSFIKRW